MSDVNPYIASEIKGIANPLDFVTAVGALGVTNKAGVGLLITALSKDATDSTDHRLYLDEMSPACRASLIRMLTSLQTAIFNVTT